MKKYIAILMMNVFALSLFSQNILNTEWLPDSQPQLVPQATAGTTYSSSNGARFPTTGTYRMLTFLINIIYDKTPTLDPFYGRTDYNGWIPTTENSINQNVPTYLQNFMSSDVSPTNNYNGFTRLIAESSFNNLIVLSDYVVINVKQSLITPNGGNFTFTQLINAAINLINQSGGLSTVYGHNSISDFDYLTNIHSTSQGISKTKSSDNYIDFLQVFARNTTKKYDSDNRLIYDYGTLYYGLGYGNINYYNGTVKNDNIYISTQLNPLRIGSTTCYFDLGTFQVTGNSNIGEGFQDVIHEFAHALYGDNSFHTSGGNHQGDTYTNTFIGKQWGYGLFGSPPSLISCNGHDRLRSGWRGSDNLNYKIAANQQNGEISGKFTGTQSFYLRDFVTYGDAIRIKLPYKDSNLASNQYIWLENHQVGLNSKLDYHTFSTGHTPGNSCRAEAIPGIYSYYQVGKDILESSSSSDVFPSNEKDNLKMISAEGNYNVSYNGTITDCLGWDPRSQFIYNSANPLSGINDQTEVYSYNLSSSSLDFATNHKNMGSKIKNGIIYNAMPWLGDIFDPFTNNSSIDISTNPASVNTLTYYSTQYYHSDTKEYTFSAIDDSRNTRKIYLTGLNIKMNESGQNSAGKIFKVDVRWDDYDVKNSVNWAGDIVLKENINLLSGKTIKLEQNKTPNQIDKDLVSGYFAGTTFLTCENGSLFTMQPNSFVDLTELSSLIMQQGSSMVINSGAKLTVKSGTTLQIKNGSTLTINGNGQINVESGGYLCIESGAIIILQDANSFINLQFDSHIGTNPSVIPSATCTPIASISKSGSGQINDYNTDLYIQNQTISTPKYYTGKNIYVAGSGGGVLINNNATVTFDAAQDVVFQNGFEVSLGASYEVLKH